MKKRMLVISLDAMISEDLEYMKTLPNLGPIVNNGSIVKNSQTVYPSLTYTAHASMISGTYPDKHGVVNNEIFNPFMKFGDWFENRTDIHANILPEECEKHGLKVLINSWPTMVGADVTWNLQRAGIHQVADDKKASMIANSTPGLMERMYELCSDAWKEDKYYDSDKFSGLASKILIEESAPDVIFMHMTLIDHYRHVYGVYSEKIKDAIKFIDEMLGYTFDALKEKGLYDETIFVICSDHGQVNIDESININQDFIKRGWITVDEDFNVTDWKVYAHSAAASAQVYVKDGDPALIKEVGEYLEANKERFRIDRMFTMDEVKNEFNLDGQFVYVLEAKEGVGYNFRLSDPFEKKVANEDYRTSVGTHGHIPTRGSQPALVISGPGIPKGRIIEKASNVDIAPTCAALLGFEMPGADGRVLKELIF